MRVLPIIEDNNRNGNPFILDCLITTTKEGIESIKFSGLDAVVPNITQSFRLTERCTFKVLGPHPQGYELAEEIREYMAGRKKGFIGYPLLWNKVTHFQRKVLTAVQDIPFGTTLSYQGLAEKINCPKGFRAVGQALKRNPWPLLVPCHRVISKDRTLGGFSSGIALKRLFLNIEHYCL